MMRLYAITNEEIISNYSNVLGPGMQDRFPMFHIQHCAPNIEVLRITDNLSNFQAMDAQPMMVNQEIQRIEDMNIFNVPMTRTEEILVDKADMSVIEHLEAIKSKVRIKTAVYFRLRHTLRYWRTSSASSLRSSMNIQQTQLVALAAQEYEEDGVISSTTFMALTLIGLDAEAILQNIEETSNG
jgi:hypothetical protein